MSIGAGASYAGDRIEPATDLAARGQLDYLVYAIVLAQVTPERVREHFRGIAKGRITRYELPQLWAINLVLEQSLGGGVTRSLSLDPHGKSYSALILTMPVDVDDAIAADLIKAGRQPI